MKNGHRSLIFGILHKFQTANPLHGQWQAQWGAGDVHYSCPVPSLDGICNSQPNGYHGEMKRPAKFADKQVLRENILMIGAMRAALTPAFLRPRLGRDKKKLARWIMIHSLSGLTYG